MKSELDALEYLISSIPSGIPALLYLVKDISAPVLIEPNVT